VNDQWSLLMQLFSILSQLLAPLIQSAVSWLLLLVWLAWWLWAVNWKKVWPVLAQGGWLVVVLLMIIAALAWSEIAPDSGYLFGGLVVSSAFWGHLIVVAILVLLALACGWLQGVLGWEPAEVDLEPPAAAAGQVHGHH
jgi:hypothetical protein